MIRRFADALVGIHKKHEDRRLRIGDHRARGITPLPLFKPRERERFQALSKELRADTNSYLAGAIKAAENSRSRTSFRKRRPAAEEQDRT
jgi:hypothetical protein